MFPAFEGHGCGMPLAPEGKYAPSLLHLRVYSQGVPKVLWVGVRPQIAGGGGGGRQNRGVFLCPLPAILERSTARTPQFPSGKKVTPPPPKDYVPSLL